MKFALVTTTIGVPEVLREYRTLGPKVPFVIAGDRGGPHTEIEEFCEEIGRATYLWPHEQDELHPLLSDTVGWENIQRRNLAIVEAVKTKPDVIVSVDDDNHPAPEYWEKLEQAFADHDGYVAEGAWFNLGELAVQSFTYRGYPFRYIQPDAHWGMNGRPRKIGIVNGLIYGDPDVNAEERIEHDPRVTWYEQPARLGIALDPNLTWSPVNAQNTAYRAELAPLMLQVPRVGRYDDIWGSYIAQAVLRTTDYHVRFGEPIVTQDRHPHDLEKDLDDEQLGMRYSLMLVDHIRRLELRSETIVGRLGEVLESLRTLELDLPYDFFDAWLEVWNGAA